MSSTVGLFNGNPGLRALDPDLPFLASEVAIDVDNLLAGVSVDQKAMRLLAEKLLNSIEIDSAGGPPRSQMDMATLTVLGEAILDVDTVEDPSRGKVEYLLTKASQIANILSDDNPQSNRKDLEHALNFCVALSRASAAYSESIRDLRPSHPFRR